MNTNKRIYGLDIMRASAIILVMLSHGHVYTNFILDVKYYRFLLWDGVGIFFVLSGFLIGGILIKQIQEKKFGVIDLLNFWRRRWLRTIPSYFLVLSILVVCYLMVHHHLPPELYKYYVFTQCFASPHPLFFGEAWSLSIEEWFYILIPLLLFFVLKLSHSKKFGILFVILLVLFVGTVIRTNKAAQKDYFVDNTFALEIMKQVITRIDSIMFGVLGAWLAFYKTNLWFKNKRLFFLLGIVIMFLCVILISYSQSFYNYFYYSLTAIGTLFLLPLLSDLKGGSGFIHRSVTFISVISYSMYLTNHMIVQRGALPILNRFLEFNLDSSRIDNLIMFFCFWGLTMVLSWILYRYWEQPILKLRRHFDS